MHNGPVWILFSSTRSLTNQSKLPPRSIAQETISQLWGTDMQPLSHRSMISVPQSSFTVKAEVTNKNLQPQQTPWPWNLCFTASGTIGSMTMIYYCIQQQHCILWAEVGSFPHFELLRRHSPPLESLRGNLGQHFYTSYTIEWPLTSINRPTRANRRSVSIPTTL